MTAIVVLMFPRSRELDRISAAVEQGCLRRVTDGEGF